MQMGHVPPCSAVVRASLKEFTSIECHLWQSMYCVFGDIQVGFDATPGVESLPFSFFLSSWNSKLLQTLH